MDVQAGRSRAALPRAGGVPIELARLCTRGVLLGSATPDVESYQRALRGRYTLLTLRSASVPSSRRCGAAVRIVASPAMPPIERGRPARRAARRQPGDVQPRAAVGAVRARSGRRRAGDALPQPPRLARARAVPRLRLRARVPFVQRRAGLPQFRGTAAGDRLVCHQCNRRWRLLRALPAVRQPARCGRSAPASERVEEAQRSCFPHARLLRWDRDVTRGRGAHERILARSSRTRPTSSSARRCWRRGSTCRR